jgi:hypothetical protein
LLQAPTGLSPQERSQIVRGLFQDNPQAGSTFLRLLLLLAAIPVAIWIVVLIQRRLWGEPVPRPTRLFRVLAKRASLRWSDRLLLIRATRRAQFKHPAAILLSANCYDRVVGDYLKATRRRNADRLERIRARLFAG